MKKIGIVAKPNISIARDTLSDLVRYLSDRGKEAVMDRETAALLGETSKVRKSDIPALVDMIVVLGGDGTLLSVARLVEGRNVPVLGVNLGGLGFLTEVALPELYPTLDKVFAQDFVADDRLMLRAHVHRHGERVAQSLVLNDVVVSKGTLSRMIRLEISIAGKFVTSLRGDGLIVATPTGSTAYSLSAGGPILYPSVDAVVLTPISPHMLTNRPIAIPPDRGIEITVRTQEEGSMVTFDGQVGFSLRENDVVNIGPAENKVRLIRSPDRDHFEVLRRKLKWGGE